MKIYNRFVILAHDHPMLHYDFMLEKEGGLATWRFNKLPGDSPFFAEKIHDHRTGYLDYEGPVSMDRGTVKRIDTGSYEIFADTSDFIIIQLNGEKYKGQINLDRMGSDTFMGIFLAEK